MPMFDLGFDKGFCNCVDFQLTLQKIVYTLLKYISI